MTSVQHINPLSAPRSPGPDLPLSYRPRHQNHELSLRFINDMRALTLTIDCALVFWALKHQYNTVTETPAQAIAQPVSNIYFALHLIKKLDTL